MSLPEVVKDVRQKDLQIIAHLRQNARMSLTKMSRKTGIPVSTLFDRLKLNESGVIIKHTSILDFAKLGYHTRADILFKVDKDDREAFSEFVSKSRFVNSVFKVNNGFNFMIECIFREVRDVEDFLDDLDNRFKIDERKSLYIIEDLKREAFMSNPDWLLE